MQGGEARNDTEPEGAEKKLGLLQVEEGKINTSDNQNITADRKVN